MKISRLIFAELIFALVLVGALAFSVVAQNSSSAQPSVENPSADKPLAVAASAAANNKPPPETAGDYLSSFEFIITAMVVVLALIAMTMEFVLLRRIVNLKAEDALRVFAVTLILTGTLFFITAGFDSNQVAPAMGLFGTVAGYLLGRSVDRKESKAHD